MNKSGSLFLGVFLPGVVIAFAIPLLIFLICALIAGLSVIESFNAAAVQTFAERHSLFAAAILGLIPVVLVTVAGWLLARKIELRRSRLIAQVGLAGVGAVLIWVNVTFWPGYLPDRVFRGFPHGLEFVIGPLFFAPVAMVAGMVVAWFATRPSSAS